MEKTESNNKLTEKDAEEIIEFIKELLNEKRLRFMKIDSEYNQKLLKELERRKIANASKSLTSE